MPLMPAHGKSRGVTTNLPEFILTLDTLLNQWGPFEAVWGIPGRIFECSCLCSPSRNQKINIDQPF